MEITEKYKRIKHHGDRQCVLHDIRGQTKIKPQRIRLRKKSGIKEPKGSGSGGKKTNYDRHGTYLQSYNYKLQSLKKYHFRYSGWQLITIQKQFKKQQLKGAILLIGKKQFRIVA